MQCVAERGAGCVASCREKEREAVCCRSCCSVCVRKRECENERERERERRRETECVIETSLTYIIEFFFIYTYICM